ncbi:outer membrane protein [Sphingomonas sp. ID0503]|uniref:outer membrane protein n=1 Tax=Sphingomonas sp. ID0503 TaxID=3399691 RepID=UPI003AFA8B94
MRRFAYAVFAAGTVMSAIAGPALSQTPAEGNFSGARVEGLLGWDRTHAYGGHDDGVLYGIGAGYDWRSGNLVVGIDAEANDSTAKECAGALCAKAGRDLYIGGRVGSVVAPNALLYAKAGYTNARYKLAYDDGSARVIDGRTFDGLRVGAGLEYALSPNSFVKAEYRYSNYEDGLSRNQVVGGFGVRF